MRLWHEELIPYLSNQRLSAQHRECCALRGLGWGRKHKTVDYVFKYTRLKLFLYHTKVMCEMKRRKFNVDEKWLDCNYRGKYCVPDNFEISKGFARRLINQMYGMYKQSIYPEHNDEYLKECLDLLEKKGEHIEWKNIK